MNVAILGASSKPERFAYRAMQMLLDHNHTPIPISLRGEDILGCPGYQSLLDIPEELQPVPTVCLYLNPQRFAEVIDKVIELAPSRIIFNPGTESAEHADKLSNVGIEVIEDCTLVMLASGTF